MVEITGYYAPLIAREMEPERIAAGFDQLGQFGFFGTLVSKSRAEARPIEEVLKTPATVFYMAQVYEAKLHDCNTALQAIRNPKTSN